MNQRGTKPMNKRWYGAAMAAWLIAGCSGNGVKKGTPDMAQPGVGGNGDDLGSSPDQAPGYLCDGLAAGDALIYVYPFSQNTKSCDPMKMASFNGLIGIWDLYGQKGATSAARVLKPTRCSDVMGSDDLGGGSKTWDGKTVPMGGPAAFQSIATIKGAFGAAGGQTVTTVAVVSAIQPWAAGKGGTFYVEDAAGAPNSGIEVYVPKTITTMPPAVGDLVQVDGATALYPAMIGAKQITATAFKTLDSGYKLSPVQALSAAMLGKDSTAEDQWAGLRVQSQDTLTVSDACPTELRYVSKGGTGGSGD